MGCESTSLRLLTEEEIQYVAGGADQEVDLPPDIVVIAPDGTGGSVSFRVGGSYTASTSTFAHGMFSDRYVVSQGVPAPSDTQGDIVVEATPEQVAAAKQAYEDAGLLVDRFQVLAGIVGALVTRRSSGAAIGGAGAAAGVYDDEIKDFIADAIYYADGRDGAYDGRLDSYNSRYYKFNGTIRHLPSD